MAKLLLDKNSNLVFLGARQINSQKGNLITFVKLGDPQTFENHDFMVDPQKFNLTIPLHASVIPDFEMGIYQNRTSLNLVSLQVAPVAAVAK